MIIKEITSQHRRDFVAIMLCEHCGHEQMDKTGYDDEFYHNNVIPAMICEKCGKKADATYTPRKPKYSEHEVI